MSKTDIKNGFVQIAKKYLGHPIPPEEAELAVKSFLEQPWIKKLLVFSETAFCLFEWPSMQYRYVSPSISNVLGIEACELRDISVVRNMLKESEVKLFLQFLEIGVQEVKALTVYERSQSRMTRNAWFTINGKETNILQHSIGLLHSESGFPQLELVMVTDITAFNNSPYHFYRITTYHPDGSERVVREGIMEHENRPITNREREIFTEIVKGKTTEEIALALNLSSETIKTHRKNLLKKTQSENTIDLLRYGYANGWL